jgi:hypothetical protein
MGCSIRFEDKNMVSFPPFLKRRARKAELAMGATQILSDGQTSTFVDDVSINGFFFWPTPQNFAK